jgi:serine/threonine protein kinase
VSRSTFGKYVLLRKLASGGMGEVFLAKQRGPSGFEKLLVIKRILSHHLDKRDYLDMFFSEAKLVARLNHNNIIQIQEMGEIDGDYYIAMEYVRGKSLRDIIDELRAEGRMLPLPHVVDLAIKLCEGLGYAHQARDIRGRPMNIVHRDINPHNVLVSYNGDLKLIDFGIAKSEMTSVHTATGTIKGKFVYMSPEQSAADPIDRRSDIFSLGIVLYEMTALENPFVRQNVVLSLEAIQRHGIPPPSSKRADAAPLDLILQRALEKRPEDRYQTATEMRDDLRNLFRGTTVEPAEEDVSIFLHDLFRADIEEEDRLLAEADRATTPPQGLPSGEGATQSSFDQPPVPALESLPEYERHSSDEEAANPTPAAFGDEEPTLSGNLEGIAQRSREMSQLLRLSPDGNAVSAMPSPEDVIPGGDEHGNPKTPTRSDRIPGRKTSVPSTSAEHASMASGQLSPVPTGANGIAARTSASPPPHLSDHVSNVGAHAFDEPINGARLEPTREMRQGESLVPFASRTQSDRSSQPPFPSSHITDEDSGSALSRPVPAWRRVGWWVAGLLVFLATAVAGFVATRAVTRSTANEANKEMPQPIGEEQAIAPIDVSDVKGEEKVPAPDPSLPPKLEPEKKAIVAQDPPKTDEVKLTPKEEKKRKAELAKAAREEEKKRKAEDRRARAELEKVEKTKRDEEKRLKAAADKIARDEEKRVKAALTAERSQKSEADKTARDEEKRLKAAADKVARDEEKKKKAEADEERRAKAEADKAARAEAEKRAAAERPKEEKPKEEPKEESAKNESELSAKAPKEKAPKEDAAVRFGTLTVSTSVELSVEVDGKSVGTSPSVIQVKKPQGKIKLFGPGVEIAVTLTYKVEEGGISVKLDSNPWAIAKHNGLSLGKTPQNVAAEPRHRFSLLRPGQSAPFVISLLWNQKSG